MQQVNAAYLGWCCACLVQLCFFYRPGGHTLDLVITYYVKMQMQKTQADQQNSTLTASAW